MPISDLDLLGPLELSDHLGFLDSLNIVSIFCGIFERFGEVFHGLYEDF